MVGPPATSEQKLSPTGQWAVFKIYLSRIPNGVVGDTKFPTKGQWGAKTNFPAGIVVVATTLQIPLGILNLNWEAPQEY